MLNSRERERGKNLSTSFHGSMGNRERKSIFHGEWRQVTYKKKKTFHIPLAMVGIEGHPLSIGELDFGSHIPKVW